MKILIMIFGWLFVLVSFVVNMIYIIKEGKEELVNDANGRFYERHNFYARFGMPFTIACGLVVTLLTFIL